MSGSNVNKRQELLSLNELLVCQQLLQDKMGHPTGRGEQGCKENLLHSIIEVVEALREINFKPWKKEQIQVDRQKLATELTDVLQFWANAANSMGFTAQELTEALRAKWQVNYQRLGLNATSMCLQCGEYGGVHKELCPQNFDAEDLRDGKLTPIR